MTVQQSQLVDKHRPKSEARSVGPALGGNLLMYLEDALEVFVEVLVGQATQFVEDTPNLNPTVGVRVGTAFGGDQKPLGPLAFLVHIRSVVVGVAQNEAGLFGQLFDERAAIWLSATSAGVSLAESGIHIPATVMARCSFHP